MLTRDFDYDLPNTLIAQVPKPARVDSRLLVLTGSRIQDQTFTDIVSLLKPNDLLVFNDTKVIPARLHGVKSTGGKVEVLVERVLNEHEVLAHIRASKAPKPGTRLILEQHIQAEMLARKGDLFHLKMLNDASVGSLLTEYGHMPLPPYIERSDNAFDVDRYQTVYAAKPGAVAAPTAGLHFNQALLERLTAHGVASTFVTLHVGAGTFQPVRAERLQDHEMHFEYLELTASVCEHIMRAKQRGGRIIAVGTTAVRSLETAAQCGQLSPFQGETNLFIYPGYQFQVVDALITNFHLPQSTLLMLVCAFAGYDEIMHAYQHAITQAYRFFSYGDAMFLSKKEKHGI